MAVSDTRRERAADEDGNRMGAGGGGVLDFGTLFPEAENVAPSAGMMTN
jgi:hypothetical protein